MNQALIIALGSLALALPALCYADIDRLTQPADFNDDEDGAYDVEADPEPAPKATLSLAEWHHHNHQPTPVGLSAPSPAGAASPAASVKSDAHVAHTAAKVAKQAAKVANRVAEHSIKVTGHAKTALKHALGALHDARVETSGLSKDQKETLKKAEGHLREATKTADLGKLKKIKDEKDLQKEKMQDDLEKSKSGKSEEEELLEEIQEIRKMLKEKGIDDKELNDAVDELEEQINKNGGKSSDETKAEIEQLRDEVEKMPKMEKEEEEEKPAYTIEKEGKQAQTLKGAGMQSLEGKGNGTANDESVTPIEDKGIDIDTQMPYGDLEPFGREDTAQELTEKSIKESDRMVDQLERAEVSEEKRAVFRALTRLRGAAITSYDGVARSQSGNIDEYNKVHKWRKQHPIHHLADEESDVTKWAFPDNAD